MVPDRDTCLALNLTWQNSVVTFDHVGHAYLALFEVAIFKGWITVMYDATDSRQVRGTPDPGYNLELPTKISQYLKMIHKKGLSINGVIF